MHECNQISKDQAKMNTASYASPATVDTSMKPNAIIIHVIEVTCTGDSQPQVLQLPAYGSSAYLQGSSNCHQRPCERNHLHWSQPTTIPAAACTWQQCIPPGFIQLPSASMEMKSLALVTVNHNPCSCLQMAAGHTSRVHPIAISIDANEITCTGDSQP
jgi:hypothetical protein